MSGTTPSTRAISLSDNPSATRSMIVRSLTVRIARTLLPNDAIPLASLPTLARSDPGFSSLTDCTSASGLALIDIMPQAPVAIAVARSPQATEAVKNTSREERPLSPTTASMSDAVTSVNPSSSSTTSGVSLRMAARQLAPSRQHATTSKSGCAPNSDTKPCKTMGRRSAITSLTRCMNSPSRPRNA